jgi:hypothetical protein
MDGTFEDEYDGYIYDSSNDPISENTFRITFFYSMSESTNEIGNGKQ